MTKDTTKPPQVSTAPNRMNTRTTKNVINKPNAPTSQSKQIKNGKIISEDSFISLHQQTAPFAQDEQSSNEMQTDSVLSEIQDGESDLTSSGISQQPSNTVIDTVWATTMEKRVNSLFDMLQQQQLFQQQERERWQQENDSLKESLAKANERVATLEIALANKENNNKTIVTNTENNTTNQVTSNNPEVTMDKASKPTMAEIAAAQGPGTLKLPKKPKKTPNGPSLKTKTAAARAFMERSSGPQGFEYVFIPRSRRITRTEVRSRLRKIGVETNRILDLIFPAAGVIGVLLHQQYIESFTTTMASVGTKILSDFDVLDPKHVGDPQYNTYSEQGRANKAIELQRNRCINALEFLNRTKPYQVGAIGRSFVEKGWIDADDVNQAMSTKETHTNANTYRQNTHNQGAFKAAAIFRTDIEEDELMETEEEAIETEEEVIETEEDVNNPNVSEMSA